MGVSRSVLLAIFIISGVGVTGCDGSRSTYIIHLKEPGDAVRFPTQQLWHASVLESATEAAEILYSYQSLLHGFSAVLSDEDVEMLEQREDVLAVLPEMRYELHTTRTPEFLGLNWTMGLIPEANSASDVVIGVLDTGVWSHSRSFSDAGMDPVPKWWKGQCEGGGNSSGVTCNRKLIGARFFCKGYEASLGPVDERRESRSPLDSDGHGTHTATTAAGAPVAGASLFGYAPGTARGMATGARISSYKVCWIGGCFSSDIFGGLDAAIKDGVQVLSLSLGGGTADFYRDNLAIGAFAATSNGIFVSCSAGNTGPSASSLSNVAPWITTVGAGTIDRDFPARIVLGDGRTFNGVSLYNGSKLPNKNLPLIYAGNASIAVNGDLCMPGTLIPNLVAGKIVVCNRGSNPRVQKGAVVKGAGGVGMILTNTEANGEELVADAHLLPAVAVGESTGNHLKAYLLSHPNASGMLVFLGTQLGINPSPVVAAFSSRGPSILAPYVLKPDLIAPGVNILAGWSGAVGPTGLSSDDRHVAFNIISGTSMSCPHISGLAALLKGAHPDWSPAAIRSALMTTAYDTYHGHGQLLDVSTGKPCTPFDAGAGHVNPEKALDPGLLYDLTSDDYIAFLCASNYTDAQIALVTASNVTCSGRRPKSVTDLNYPSFAVPLSTASGDGGRKAAITKVKYTRTVTNVGQAGTYTAYISPLRPAAPVKIRVFPRQLTFSRRNEKKSYTVTFTARSMPSGQSAFSRIYWLSGKYLVGSPVAITWT